MHMSEYENPPIPEGINVSPTHPLKEFALLLGGVSALLLAVVLSLSLAAGYLVRFIPFSQEQALASRIEQQWLKPGSIAQPERQAYLQDLANRLSSAMSLPPAMPIQVHYVDSPTVNAMATLGGHVVVFQGLIDILPNENALAMVMAHEIAHVRHRHPIIAMGRGFTVALALSSLAGLGDSAVQQWLGSMGMLPLLSFSREQEAQSDADALNGLYRLYGHVRGADALFAHLDAAEKLPQPPAFLNTHPGHQDRLKRIQQFAASHPERNNNPEVLLPTAFRHAPSTAK